MKQGLSIVIPVYNEVKSVASCLVPLIDQVSKYDFPVEMILVNDASNDGTEEKLNTLKYPCLTVLNHEYNRGYGASLKTGIKFAKYDYVAITDADDTYPNDRIPEFFEKCLNEKCDMVVGARTNPDAAIPLVRRPAKWVLKWLASILTGRRIPDLNSGFRIFKKDIMLKYKRILCNQFSFTSTITLAFLCDHYRVIYYPIDYFSRNGQSKIKPFRDTMNFVMLIITTVLYFKPLRMLFLPGSLFFLGGMIYSGYGAILFHNVNKSALLLIQLGTYFLVTGLLADLIIKTRRD